MADDGDSGRDLIRDLLNRISKLEAKVSDLERQVVSTSITLQQGISGGAQREMGDLRESFHEIRSDLTTVRSELTALQMKANKLEGGGVVIYAGLTTIGGLLGWFLSHFGISK